MKAQCPECKNIYKAPDEYLGKKAKCPKCNKAITVVVPSEKTSERHAKKQKHSPDDSRREQNKTSSDTCYKNNSRTQLHSQKFSDKLLNFAFSIVRSISIGIIVMSFLTILVCAVGLSLTISRTTEPKKEIVTPLSFLTYKEYFESQAHLRKSGEQKTPSKIDLYAPMSFVEENSNRINALCKKYNLEKDYIISQLLDIENKYGDLDEIYRHTFLDGIEEYVHNSKIFFENQEDTDGEFIISVYVFCDDFIKNIDRVELAMEEAKLRYYAEKSIIIKRRIYLLASILVSIGFILVFIFLPLLIQIERNTRSHKGNDQTGN